MTVRDVFEMRRQGRFEEAYDAIRPMYAVHKGRYTTLCMYLTARDVFNLRLHEGRTDEAAKILAALKRLQPNLEDTDGNVARFMQSAEQRLAQVEGLTDGAVIPSKEKICAIRAIRVTELSAGQTKVLDCIKAHPGLRVPGIEAETGIPAKSIERHVSVLIDKNLIEHRGSKKTGGYY